MSLEVNLICEHRLDLKGADHKVVVRLFTPEPRKDGPGWKCRFEIGEPFSYGLDVYGEWSIQALVLAISGLSATLYASDEYREGQLGIAGEFGDFLGLPAPAVLLDEAPYPF